MYIDRTLYDGRPQDSGSRPDNENKCYDFLDGLGVAYQRIDHEPSVTMEMCREVKSIMGLTVCKNLFLTNRSGKELYLLLMPGEKPFRTSIVSKLIGASRLSFATPERMEQYIGTTPGSASILGLMFDTEKKVRLIIDEEVFDGEYFGCHPCRNTSSLKIRTSDMKSIVIPALGHEPTYIRIEYPDSEEN